ncbi:MAG: nucleoside triphosphate pyrophosphohydrolase family protein [Clostridiaceae bacterium]
MNFKEYQEKALRTANGLDQVDKLLNGIMGLNGEAGECIDILKKYLYQDHPMDIDNLISELGDVLWYLNLSANALGVTLEEVAMLNIEKLEKRYPQHIFRKEDSLNRKSSLKKLE